jgi:hypothetical protein
MAKGRANHQQKVEMREIVGRVVGSILMYALIFGAFMGPVGAAAQSGRFESGVDRIVPAMDEETALDRGRYAVLIDLDENRLYFKQGELTLWSAPVGTGTGIRLVTDSDDWEFNTPTGRFQVQYKERDPVWIAPDWYFVENNLPVPDTNHPSRYMTGTLGVAAVYISPHVAIHGTNRPELIGQRVSHGCIRLENRYALRLYHNVQVGTEVIIVGGEEARRNARTVDMRDGYDPSLASTGGRSTAATDRLLESWKRLDTDALLDELNVQLRRPSRDSRWDEVAVLLLQRATEGDDLAMEALLTRGPDLGSERMRREWATFVAYAYRNAPVGTLEALSRLESRQRRSAAGLIVSSTMTLYYGDLDTPSAPWPTNRLPATAVPAGARRGWSALEAAERQHREELTRADAPAGGRV